MKISTKVIERFFTSKNNSALEEFLPDSFKDNLEQIGRSIHFTGQYWKAFGKTPGDLGEIIRQSYFLGYKSLTLVGITAFIIGMVMTLQSIPTMKEFGATSWIPYMVSISLVREIGPVITALICAGKLASGISAELGAMKVTEQIDAMEVSGCKPYKFLVVTRVTACTIMIPLLVIFADVIALYGSFVAMNFEGQISPALYFTQVIEALEFADVIPAFIKSILFGFTIGMVGSYMGYNVRGGTTGVGRAANKAVVTASLIIFIIDMLAVEITHLMIH